MTTPSNLVLVGMPASGKSTVGVLAAKILGLDFSDTDLLLQRQEGKRLHAILQTMGPEGFLAAENRLLAGLQASRTLISTGGSAIYHPQGMTNLKSLGSVVWLDVPFAELERRLGDMATRGVVLAQGQSLRDLYDERLSLYAGWADWRLKVGREDLEVTVGNLVSLVRPMFP